MRIIEITDRDGRKRRVDMDDPSNVIRSGDKITIGMMLRDAASGALFMRDAAYDPANPYALSDADLKRVDDAREERIRRTSDAWRGEGHGEPEQPVEAAIAFTVTDEDYQRAEAARQQRIQRTSDAWRNP
jgi:hypothetical protein